MSGSRARMETVRLGYGELRRGWRETASVDVGLGLIHKDAGAIRGRRIAFMIAWMRSVLATGSGAIDTLYCCPAPRHAAWPPGSMLRGTDDHIWPRPLFRNWDTVEGAPAVNDRHLANPRHVGLPPVLQARLALMPMTLNKAMKDAGGAPLDSRRR